MKLGETSLLELPLRLLARIFPNVKEHYAGNYRNTAGFEHFFTGFICTLIFGHLMRITPWLGLGLIPIFVMHVIWKEVIHDAHKRTTPEEWKIFWVNLIERTAGFVFGLPFLIGV